MKTVLIVAMTIAGLAITGIVNAQEAPKPSTEDLIKERCAAEWPSDFSMQKYCREKQSRGLHDVGAWLKRHGVSGDSCKAKKTPWCQMAGLCFGEWADEFGPDWAMVGYCLKKQETSYKEMNP
jgi:hypothetical protein